MSRIFEDLKSIKPVLTDNMSAIRLIIKKQKPVYNLTQALLHHDIKESEIKDFTENLLKDIKIGYRFEHEILISAIAMAMEDINSKFADEYLESLASIKMTEMRFVSRFAEECLKHRIHNYD